MHNIKHDAEALDHVLLTVLGRMTGGISPAALILAFLDVGLHLALNPSKQLNLLENYVENQWKLWQKHFLGIKDEEDSRHPIDKRFADPSWQQFPFQYLYEAFLLHQNWFHSAAINVRGASCHHEDVVDFTIRQILDMLSPSNSPLFNPEIQKSTIQQKGKNLIKGYENFVDDIRRTLLNEPVAGSEHFVIGKNIAVTKGEVIYQNKLIELIQYAPLTKTVYAEPILITPAWIMKYYILDLTPKHSLVKYLVSHGHTVFMISWKNPTRKDRNLGMEDYLNLGIMSALKVISNVTPNVKIHLLGYCLGGTLAAIAAATMARDNDDRLASLTLLAAQTDFTDPGELGLFIDESQIAFLESLMMQKGYLDTHQMAGAFQLLRSNDLIWSRMIREYILGERKQLRDLMFWNSDATRLPYKMHSEYLRNLFLRNQLSEGKYHVDDKPIALPDITVPLFVVATEKDHVSPWRSVFQINLLVTGDVTFTLTSGGHNVGIVSMPVKKTKRHFRIATLKEGERYIDANTWYKTTKVSGGSWWPAFEKWLSEQSTVQVNPPSMGAPAKHIKPIRPAPGEYVLQR